MIFFIYSSGLRIFLIHINSCLSEVSIKRKYYRNYQAEFWFMKQFFGLEYQFLKLDIGWNLNTSSSFQKTSLLESFRLWVLSNYSRNTFFFYIINSSIFLIFAYLFYSCILFLIFYSKYSWTSVLKDFFYLIG